MHPESVSDSSVARRRIYDRLAGRYDRVFAPLERLFLARLRSETLRHVPAGSKLLEIGAGTGLNFSHYHPTINPVATEPSAEMISIAASRLRDGRPALLRCEAEHLPFADHSFDAVVATLVFCSVTSPAECFREIKRVTKNGGRLVLLEHVRPPNLLGPAFDLLSLATVALFDDHFNRQTSEEAEKAGLRIQHVDSHYMGIMQLIVAEN